MIQSPVRRFLPCLVLLAACAAPAPQPVPAPEPVVEVPSPAEEKVIGTAKVSASALNVRREPSTEADVVTQVKRGVVLAVLAENEGWTKVRLQSGETGWASSRFLVSPDAKAAKRPAKGRKGCPPDSDFAFVDTPTLAFSDSGAHGLVVIEATVNTKGVVTATHLVSNSTGDEALAFLAAKEIKSATFTPPIRSCVPRSFIFTYRRTF